MQQLGLDETELTTNWCESASMLEAWQEKRYALLWGKYYLLQFFHT